MRRVKLDKIDLRILRDLQANGRMTNVELAKRAGISAPPCLRRVRALEEAGYVRGYHADVNAEALGYGVTVFAQVGLSSQAESDLVAFERLVEQWPLVRDCYMLAGETDFLLRIVRHRLGQLQQVPDVGIDVGAECQPCEICSGDPCVQARAGHADR